MKFLRNIAYAVIGLCAVLSIVILTYKGKTSDTDSENTSVAVTETESSKEVVVEDGEITAEDVLSAASVIISDVKDDVVSAVTSASNSASENTSGEISYAEIVRLQEEEVALEQKALVAESNKANGITASTSSTVSNTSDSTTKNYRYVVNKTTKRIHKVGCLMEPTGDNALYFETLTEAVAAGYSEKCTICSP